MFNRTSLNISILLFLLLSFPVFIFSQTQKQPKFGKISMEQLQKKADDKFPNAHAVILFDYGESYYRFMPGTGKLNINFERHVAIQFFDNTEFDLATFEVQLYKDGQYEQNLGKVKGYTYNLTDGKFDRTKFSKKDIITEELRENWKEKKFTMPNVQEGSIIEVKYNVSSDFPQYMEPWFFQSSVPTRYSEYNIEIPEFFTFNKSFSGFYAPYIKPRKKNTQNDYLVFKEGWAMTDLPAFEGEDYMRDEINYMSRIEFELESFQVPFGPIEYFSKTWDDIRKDLMENKSFGRELKKRKAVKEIVRQHGGAVDEAHLVAIYEYVKLNTKWNGRANLYSRSGSKKCLQEGKGNSGEINILLIAALLEAGFEVRPVLLSTRSNGMIPLTSPTIDKLNYVIAGVALNGKTIYLDATDDFCPAGTLPLRCYNGEAIILGKDKVRKVYMESPQKQKTATQCKLSLTPDGMLEGVIKKTKSGYAAVNFRKQYKRADDESAFLESLENQQEGLTIESHEFGNLKNIYKSIKEEYDVTIDDKVEMAGNLIYFNPMLNNAFTENPFKLEKRQYPVDYAIPIDRTYVLQLTIPEGYGIETLPEKLEIALPERATNFTYTTKVMGNTLTVISRFKINKTLFVESEYPALKEFYNLIIKKHSEQIVLKKL